MSEIMASLQIIKASAGSGKTYYLTGEFLQLLFRHPPRYFTHILAVTFTNKATAEMKGRIVEELNKLSNEQKSGYIDKIKEVTDLSEIEIRVKAGQLINYILHDYSSFHVETIDSFFQKIIKVFTRELGINSGFTLELDTSAVLQEAIARFTDSLQSGTTLFDWTIEQLSRQINEGKSWTVKQQLTELGQELFKESYYLHQSRQPRFEHIKEFRQEVMAETAKLENKMKHIAQMCKESLESNGVDLLNDLNNKLKGVGGFIAKMAGGSFVSTNSYVEKALSDPNAWTPKNSRHGNLISSLAQATLNPKIEEIKVLLSTYHTYKAMLQNIFAMGVMAQLHSEINQIKSERNIFLISETTPFIHQIIDGNDAPFVYERIGNWYSDYMIDEFQDTSGMQYGNFSPLIRNSLAEGKSALVVGDIKQSIYRWRNSEWEILGRRIQENFSDFKPSEHTLDTNWRSLQQVIGYNNTLFKQLAQIMQQVFLDEDGLPASMADSLMDFGSIYADVVQKVSPKGAQRSGYVENTFIGKDEKADDEYFVDWLIATITQLLNSGYRGGDIALLVHRKVEGKLLARCILQAKADGLLPETIEVVSNETLQLSGSGAIQIIIACLRYYLGLNIHINKKSVITNCQALFHHDKLNDFNSADTDTLWVTILPLIEKYRSQPLNEMVEGLISGLALNSLVEEQIYLHTLLDLIKDYCAYKPADLFEFIAYWDEMGATQSISIPENKQGIRILTIHKSKGLQFPVVIMPFCDWNLRPPRSVYLWHPPVSIENTDISALPITCAKGLGQTAFASLYFHERYHQLIDQLNLLYVAFTRAEEALFTYAVYQDGKSATIGDLLHAAVSITDNMRSKEGASQCFYVGAFPSKEHDESEADVDPTHIIKPFEGKLSSPNLSASSLSEVASQLADVDEVSNKERGIIWHEILAKINRREDIKSALNKAVYEGIIVTKHLQEYQQQLEDLLSDTQIEHWFDGTYKVLTEASILLPDGTTRRPDRVMYSENEILVVDYKFSHEGVTPSHKKQMQVYVDLLKEMNWTSPRGYLWYVDESKIVSVE